MNLDDHIEALAVLGIKPLPALGSNGQVLKVVAGAAAWAADEAGAGGGGGAPPTPDRSLVVTIGATTYTTNTYAS